ncbi:MAG: 4Fe-4S binding protein, partial [Clostridia bacterium]|nr:4Fe-4S binding protein [Clostridia bacterium]
NIAFFTTGKFPETSPHMQKLRRRLHIEEYCEGCGACVERCGQNALTLVRTEAETEENPYDFGAAFARSAGIAQETEPHRTACVDPEKCVLCGYCTSVCPVFALKVY